MTLSGTDALGQDFEASWSDSDADVPEPGQVFYYLVSRIGCEESGLGANGAGAARPNPEPCAP